MEYRIGIFTFYSDELYHHGIKGQRWGVRRFVNEDGTLTPEGKRRYGSIENFNSSRQGQKYAKKQAQQNQSFSGSSKIKTGVKIGLAVAGTGLAAYGAYKLYKSGMLSKDGKSESSEDDIYTAMARDSVNSIINPKNSLGLDTISDKAKAYIEQRKNSQIDSKTGLYLKKALGSIQDDAKLINPNFNGEDAKDIIGSYAMRNCGLCSTAFDMRRRGYDVIAGLSDNAMTEGTISSWYKGGKFSSIIGDTARSFAHASPSMKSEDAKKAISMLSQEKGSRGILSLMWGGYSSGHYVSYDVDADGIFRIVDGQNSKIYEGADAIKYFEKVSSIAKMRTDILEPDIDALKKLGVIR